MSPFFWHEIMNKSNSLGFPDNMSFYCLGYHEISSICSNKNISLFINITEMQSLEIYRHQQN